METKINERVRKERTDDTEEKYKGPKEREGTDKKEETREKRGNGNEGVSCVKEVNVNHKGEHKKIVYNRKKEYKKSKAEEEDNTESKEGKEEDIMMRVVQRIEDMKMMKEKMMGDNQKNKQNKDVREKVGEQYGKRLGCNEDGRRQ